MTPLVSVIVPVLDEAARLGTRLAELACLPVHEVIVVDGGSRDDSVAIALAAGARVLTSTPGRSCQLNAGADAATGDVLWFLHADTQLPDDAVAHLEAALSDPDVVAGAFHTRTVNDGPPSWVEPLLRLADLRASYTSLPYGDQALFVRRSAFEAVGRFPCQELFEDLELSRRLWGVGRVRVVPASVRVSGRRFVATPFRTTVIMHTFPLLYRLGVAPGVLATWYANVR